MTPKNPGYTGTSGVCIYKSGCIIRPNLLMRYLLDTCLGDIGVFLMAASGNVKN